MSGRFSINRILAKWRLRELFLSLGETELLYEGKASCGYIIVAEKLFRGHLSRLLFVDGALESAAVMEEGSRETLLFPYMRGFDMALALHPDIGNAFLIGGGGFVYPYHFLSERPSASIDVAEISTDIIDLSRRFFFLKELEENPRFRLHTADGLSYLLGTNSRYDVIINDAFVGSKADPAFFRDDGIALLKAHLNTEGIYVCNLVTVPEGPRGMSAKRLKQHFSVHFRRVSLLRADEKRRPYEKQNCLLIASDRDL